MVEDYPKKIETNRGELVRSKYEMRVANFFHNEGIKYDYEKPLMLSDRILVRPDFYLPCYDVYIEIWGMKDDPQYNYIRHRKREQYQSYNIKLIELWPNNFDNFKWFLKKKFEEVVGVQFPVSNVPYYRNGNSTGGYAYSNMCSAA